MPSQSGPSNHRHFWIWECGRLLLFSLCSKTAFRDRHTEQNATEYFVPSFVLVGCVVLNYSCQKPRVCLFMILTQLGLNLVIPPFSCHFLHIHMVVECILALSSTLHLIWNWLKWQHKFWNNSDFTYLVLPSARTTMSLSIQCSLSGTSWRNSSKK